MAWPKGVKRALPAAPPASPDHVAKCSGCRFWLPIPDESARMLKLSSDGHGHWGICYGMPPADRNHDRPMTEANDLACSLARP